MAGAFVLLSGGLDSATLVASLTGDGGKVSALFIDYGQGAAVEEEVAARAVASFYEAPLRLLRLSGLTCGVGEIRGRNAFLLHCALLAAPLEPTVVAIAIHGGVPYVDCGEDFVNLYRDSFALHTGGEIDLAAPFLSMSKGEVLGVALELGVPLDLTYSCERGGTPCGVCLSCLDRAHLDALA